MSDIEKGRRFVSVERAAKFARILEYPVSAFVASALEDHLRDAGLKMTVKTDSGERLAPPTRGLVLHECDTCCWVSMKLSEIIAIGMPGRPIVSVKPGANSVKAWEESALRDIALVQLLSDLRL
jgi:hypothetical protein